MLGNTTPISNGWSTDTCFSSHSNQSMQVSYLVNATTQGKYSIFCVNEGCCLLPGKMGSCSTDGGTGTFSINNGQYWLEWEFPTGSGNLIQSDAIAFTDGTVGVWQQWTFNVPANYNLQECFNIQCSSYL